MAYLLTRRSGTGRGDKPPQKDTHLARRGGSPIAGRSRDREDQASAPQGEIDWKRATTPERSIGRAFRTLGVVWLQHSALTRTLRAADGALCLLNLLVLLIASFLHSPSFVLYAVGIGVSLLLPPAGLAIYLASGISGGLSTRRLHLLHRPTEA